VQSTREGALSGGSFGASGAGSLPVSYNAPDGLALLTLVPLGSLKPTEPNAERRPPGLAYEGSLATSD
jgi:hypothetical protein